MFCVSGTAEVVFTCVLRMFFLTAVTVPKSARTADVPVLLYLLAYTCFPRARHLSWVPRLTPLTLSSFRPLMSARPR